VADAVEYIKPPELELGEARTVQVLEGAAAQPQPESAAPLYTQDARVAPASEERAVSPADRNEGSNSARSDPPRWGDAAGGNPLRQNPFGSPSQIPAQVGEQLAKSDTGESAYDLRSRGRAESEREDAAPEIPTIVPEGTTRVDPPRFLAQQDVARDASSTAENSDYDAAWESAHEDLKRNRLDQALQSLSAWYGSPDLPPGRERELVRLLDELAGTVIYSTQHNMEPAYEVLGHETLQDLAEQKHVPWQLLANINGISRPDVLLPGQRLKVISGPFSAQVHVERGYITLFLRGHYAGRFPFTSGRDRPPIRGKYRVVSKVAEPVWYDSTGRELPCGHRESPYGKHFLDLGGGLSIHGEAISGSERGCISVSPRDAQDLYGILSVGSQVTVR
jgi:lipoprotein-anchoring transpeptidase ErfK/SrfK